MPFAERQLDGSRVDVAVQACLSVFREDGYFQFVVALASDVDFRLRHGARDAPNEHLWNANRRLAAQ